jgi:hypothetical protein
MPGSSGSALTMAAKRGESPGIVSPCGGVRFVIPWCSGRCIDAKFRLKIRLSQRMASLSWGDGVGQAGSDHF